MLRLSVLLFCISSLVSSFVVHADNKAVILLIKSTDSLSFSEGKTLEENQSINVIKSTDTFSFSEGQTLEINQSINVPLGTEVIVAFANGDTQTLKGPYNGKLKAPVSDYFDPTIRDLVTKLVEYRKNRKNPTMRAGIQSQSDTNWSVVNVDSSARARYHCVAPSSHGVVLWRPKISSASTVIIKHKATRKGVRVKWPAHQSTLTWPEDKLPLIYGETYTVKITNRTGSSNFKKLVLYQLPERLPTKSHKVVWMVGRGCIPQANILLASLR